MYDVLQRLDNGVCFVEKEFAYRRAWPVCTDDQRSCFLGSIGKDCSYGIVMVVTDVSQRVVVLLSISVLFRSTHDGVKCKHYLYVYALGHECP